MRSDGRYRRYRHVCERADHQELAPLDWDDVRGTLETNLTQESGTGGPGHHTFWLSTLDADGRSRTVSRATPPTRPLTRDTKDVT
jgi:hypothetical protein